MMSWIRLAAAGMALVLASLPWAGGARAQTLNCVLSAPTLAFGTVNVLSGSPSYASGTVTANCTSTYSVAITAYACLSVGTGSGGGTTTARTLSSGAATLPVELRQTAGSPAQIGDGTANPQEGPMTAVIPANGSVTASFPITGIIRPQGALPAPGTYTSVFTGTQFELIGTTTVSSTCAQVDGSALANYTSTLTVTATVPNQCSVSATSLAFPPSSLLATALQATATVSVTCNTTSSVAVSIDNGGYGSGPTTRQMASGTNRVTYGIYRDSARSQPWGTGAGTTVPLNTTGSSTASATAYGLVPAQSGKPPGAYSDVVNVTVTY